ncbi:hypothetical protein VXQ00_04735 [Acinetobacter baumannii]|uniref:hypothetical protein n=1 Tax=Acinetobacter baumannii TaxID=470 RepID=UPI003A850F70
MKPEQFIREYGVEKARHVLSGLPNYYTHMTDDAHMFISEHNKDLDENIRKQLPSLMRLDDLKRLVESIDLVESWGGIEDLKLYDLSHSKDKPESAGYKLLHAIADYESIYGGGDV